MPHLSLPQGRDRWGIKCLRNEAFYLNPWRLRKKVVNLQTKIKIKENVLCWQVIRFMVYHVRWWLRLQNMLWRKIEQVAAFQIRKLSLLSKLKEDGSSLVRLGLIFHTWHIWCSLYFVGIWSGYGYTPLVVSPQPCLLFDRWRASCNYGDCSCQAVSASCNFHD